MRNRLTARTLRASEMDPGLVGNPDRKLVKMEDYKNNASEFGKFDLVDDSRSWERSNERDEYGWGTPSREEGGKIRASVAATAARIRTANKATVLAQMLLGDKAPVSEIKAQAREFMALGYRGICASIRRWVATAPEEDLQVVETEEAPAAPAAEAPATEAPAVEAPAAPAPVAEAPAAPAEPAPAPKEAPAVPEGGELQNEVSELEGAEEPAAEAPAENTTEPDMVIDIPEAQDNIGQEAFQPDAQINQGTADPELESLFSGEEAEVEIPAAAPAQAPKAAKTGIKHLAAQPRLASKKTTIEDLSGLWTGLQVKGL